MFSVTATCLTGVPDTVAGEEAVTDEGGGEHRGGTGPEEEGGRTGHCTGRGEENRQNAGVTAEKAPGPPQCALLFTVFLRGSLKN